MHQTNRGMYQTNRGMQDVFAFWLLLSCSRTRGRHAHSVGSVRSAAVEKVNNLCPVRASRGRMKGPSVCRLTVQARSRCCALYFPRIAFRLTLRSARPPRPFVHAWSWLWFFAPTPDRSLYAVGRNLGDVSQHIADGALSLFIFFYLPSPFSLLPSSRPPPGRCAYLFATGRRAPAPATTSAFPNTSSSRASRAAWRSTSAAHRTRVSLWFDSVDVTPARHGTARYGTVRHGTDFLSPQ